MKYLPVFFWVMVLQTGALAQTSNAIRGKIINGETASPIPNASIFITNTSKGTVSSATGEFELSEVPSGTYDLVVSCIGYATQVYTYTASQLPLRIQVQMAPKAEDLQEVVIEPVEKNGWEKWGKFFLENFIGTSGYAQQCSIKNQECLRFRNSKKKNQLTVTASAPLLIENKALGYTVQYQLETFTYNFNENILQYFGYSLFKPLNGQPPKSRQVSNREKAYRGSIAHFMTSLYQNTLAAEGFEVKRLVKTANLEKDRVKKILKNSMLNSRSKDSSDYYEHILRQPDMLETYGQSLLTADSLVSRADTATKKLLFPDFLYITYKKAKEDPAYLLYTRENRQVFYQRSVVFLINNHPLSIGANGNYYMPQDLISYGYWSWSEKIATMLPLDYK